MEISNSLIAELKSYLTKYISSDLAPSIIEKIEMIEKALKEKNPELLNRIISETKEFIKTEIFDYETKVLEEKRKEEKRIAEEKRKEEERIDEENRK